MGGARGSTSPGRPSEGLHHRLHHLPASRLVASGETGLSPSGLTGPGSSGGPGGPGPSAPSSPRTRTSTSPRRPSTGGPPSRRGRSRAGGPSAGRPRLPPTSTVRASGPGSYVGDAGAATRASRSRGRSAPTPSSAAIRPSRPRARRRAPGGRSRGGRTSTARPGSCTGPS